MRKLLQIWLMSIFIFQVIGYYLVFPMVSWGIKNIKRAGMEAGVFEKELVVIKLEASQIKNNSVDFQKTDDDEFSYKGHMYDISSYKTIGDTAIFYCYNDKDEDQLFSDLDDHVHDAVGFSPTSSGKKHETNKVNKLQKEYLKTYLWVRPCNSRYKNHNPVYHCSFYIPVDIEFETPPPRRIV